MRARLSSETNGMDDFLKLFRDEEDMKENYPETYLAYTNTQNMLQAKRSMSAIVDEDDAGKEFDIDVVHISYTDETKQYVQVDLRATAQDPEGYCILTASCPQIMQEKSGDMNEVAGSVSTDFTGDQEMVSLTLPASYFGDAGDASLEVEARLYMVDSQITPYASSEMLSLYGLNYSSEITVEKPVRTHSNKENTDINICYLYQPGVAADLRDYYYSRSDLSDGNLRIPNKGKIVVSGVSLSNICKTFLLVTNTKGDSRSHCNASATLEDSQTISWDIPDNWGIPYQEFLDSLYSYVTYKLEITAVGKGKLYTFVVTNEAGAKESRNKKIIDSINIYKDCFEKGTGILMEDGSVKKVEELAKGNIVKTPDGTKKTVLDVGSIAVDTAVVHIRGENGKEIYVSKDHPFATDNGLICARFLQEGDTIMAAGGKVKIAEICVTPGLRLTMYQVVTDNGGNGRLYANGFLVGDSVAELSEAEKVNNLKYQVPEAWRKDFESWMSRNE